MKSADKIAQEIYEDVSTPPRESSGKYLYDSTQIGQIAFASHLSKETSTALIGPNNLNFLEEGLKYHSHGYVDSETAASFLTAAVKAREEATSKDTQDKIDQIVKDNARTLISHAMRSKSGREAIEKHSKKTPGFTDDFIRKSLEEPTTTDISNLQTIASYGHPEDQKKDSELKKSLGNFIDNEATAENLTQLFEKDLNQSRNHSKTPTGDLNIKVVSNLYKRYKKEFKDHLKSWVLISLSDHIKHRGIANMEVDGQSLLKASLQDDSELAAKLMKSGFTLADKEIEKYTPPNKKKFTKNDHLRMAIGEIYGQKVDLSQKQSPLALAKETGQTKLAEALQGQGYKRSMKEVLLGRGAAKKTSSASKGIMQRIKKAMSRGK